MIRHLSTMFAPFQGIYNFAFFSGMVPMTNFTVVHPMWNSLLIAPIGLVDMTILSELPDNEICNHLWICISNRFSRF